MSLENLTEADPQAAAAMILAELALSELPTTCIRELPQLEQLEAKPQIISQHYGLLMFGEGNGMAVLLRLPTCWECRSLGGQILSAAKAVKAEISDLDSTTHTHVGLMTETICHFLTIEALKKFIRIRQRMLPPYLMVPPDLPEETLAKLLALPLQ
ncbi:MAG: hypothetical protein WC675_04855 [Patescibacteria group bacterium]|jgi:hypothetical protein